MSITKEQLEEIEKLAEAATPGPWKTVVDEFHADSGAHQVALHDCFTEQDADKNAAFIRAMRKYTLPLIEALEEAWERDEQHIKVLEQYRLEVEDCKRRMGDLLDQLAREEADAHQFQKERDQYQAWMLSANDELTKVRKVLSEANELRVELTKERNEARAEIERLRKLLNPSPKPDLGATLMRLMREGQRKEIYSRAWQEAILEGNTREQAHCIAADAVKAALKEEG